jgi:hypothetical protein
MNTIYNGHGEFARVLSLSQNLGLPLSAALARLQFQYSGASLRGIILGAR